jgi:tetratricopeptide (TPR) repeat protein
LRTRKESGNRWFKFQNFSLAANAYEKGALIAAAYMKLNEKNDFDKKKMTELYIACLNNLAACHISRGNMIRAKAETKKVLEIDPTNVKALLRTARASLAIQDWDDCQNCLETIMNSQKPSDEWYQFALAEMRRLERAKEKFYTDVSPEAKVKNAAMSVVRNSSPKTPIESLTPEVSAKVKKSMIRTRSYLTFYVRWISFLMILICFSLILYILFFGNDGLNINVVVDFVKDFVKFVKTIKVEDVKHYIENTVVHIKSISVDDMKEKVLEITIEIKNSEWYASFLKAYYKISNLSGTQIKDYVEDMKIFDVNGLKTVLSTKVEQISLGSIQAIEYFKKEGTKTLSAITRQKVDEPITLFDQLPASTFGKSASRFGKSDNFGAKLQKDGPVVALATSILLAIGKNLRF